MNQTQFLESTVSEYQRLVATYSLDEGGRPDQDQLMQGLTSSHDWTEQGAHQLVLLATQYGGFFLRNALALAIALNIEDGELGL